MKGFTKDTFNEVEMFVLKQFKELEKEYKETMHEKDWVLILGIYQGLHSKYMDEIVKPYLNDI
jgi:hypothetical protein